MRNKPRYTYLAPGAATFEFEIAPRGQSYGAATLAVAGDTFLDAMRRAYEWSLSYSRSQGAKIDYRPRVAGRTITRIDRGYAWVETNTHGHWVALVALVAGGVA
jgi:hypothetical protein